MRSVTPRPVRKAMHPVRTATRAATPRSVRQVKGAVYAGTHPVNATGNAVLRSSRAGGSGRSPKPRSSSADGGVRAAEAVDMHEQLTALMAVRSQRFEPAERRIVPDPEPVRIAAFRREEWARRKSEVRLWQRAERKRLRSEVAAQAAEQAAAAWAKAVAEQQDLQAQSDADWAALSEGQPEVLTAALEAAFTESATQAEVIAAAGPHAALAVLVPVIEVMPAKKAHITPTGRLSCRTWTKTELHETYASCWQLMSSPQHVESGRQHPR